MPRRTLTLNALHARRLAATSTFTKAADELALVAADYRTVADDAYATAHAATATATDAVKAAVAAEDQASKILALLG